mmetsp:Transcript_24106/g.30336  ORF Transcript_24106/g.30336 Transcript_24106/m.30336 type:complete len:299 (+) Transcript_24106:112-1008(+)
MANPNSLEEADKWLAEKKLNSYGDPEDMMYMGGSPLFNEATGESTDRYTYLKNKYPDEPWLSSKSKSQSSTTATKQLILFIGNTAIIIMWFRVCLTFFSHGKFGFGFGSESEPEFSDFAPITMNETMCTTKLRPRTAQALIISTIELLNSLTGLTKSNPMHVLLFASVRTGVELIAAPQLACNSPQHLFTVFMWSLDGIIRFGCFAADAALFLLGRGSPGSVPVIKSVRYTVGPILFPFGAGGEMVMVLSIALQTGNWAIYFAASLWPLGFYPLMKTLLKQRRRHFQKLREGLEKKKD